MKKGIILGNFLLKMNKFNFNLDFLRKNFKVENFCNELDYLVGLRSENFDLYKEQVGIYKYLIYFSFYKKVPLLNTVLEVDDTSDFEKDYHILDKEFNSEKNSKIREEIARKIMDGSLFEFMSDNFKLIYHFPMQCIASLIYSKLNKKYYYIYFYPYFAENDGQKPDVNEGSHEIINLYDQKISEKDFFNEILKHFRDEDLGFEDGTLVKGRDDYFFQDLNDKNINYWQKIAYDNYDE